MSFSLTSDHISPSTFLHQPRRGFTSFTNRCAASPVSDRILTANRMTHTSTVVATRSVASTMRAAVITAAQKTEIAEAAIPEPSAHEVRVKIEGCGVCLSNIPLWEGRNWFNYPRDAGAPGREAWGRIDALGSEVKNLSPGDRVTMLSHHAFAEYDLARAGEVAILPHSLMGKPFPGEALANAMNVFRRASPAPGANVAIVGVGFLGALLTQLVARGGARVIAISRREFALYVAREMGAAETIALDDDRRGIGEGMELP